MHCMNSDTTFEIESRSSDDTLRIGRQIGAQLRGGEVLELVGDIGSGKTVFVRGLAEGIGSIDQVMSPTFTISRMYSGNTVDLHHFDFYRLSEPGIMRTELAESIEQNEVTVVIEWSNIVEDVLPRQRLRIAFTAISDDVRTLTVTAPDATHEACIQGVI